MRTDKTPARRNLPTGCSSQFPRSNVYDILARHFVPPIRTRVPIQPTRSRHFDNYETVIVGIVTLFLINSEYGINCIRNDICGD
ncbi:hypothetical protein CDAR_4951 [Caerostris darwini]|uniref:Uncharacterized protein n=1 Tax=Caerostris darwini TaxID=1538125 RepID=A0AAV4P5A2_9ARAC|nr:hypothetical protein CDAR_4951 [Caerostris darwini]